MLVIRLRRTGSKKRPFFRVVVTDSRVARDSSFVEVLGYYNPRTKPETLNVKRDRLDHWLKAGALPSDTVRTLVARMPDVPPAAVGPAAAPPPAVEPAVAQAPAVEPAATQPAASEQSAS